MARVNPGSRCATLVWQFVVFSSHLCAPPTRARVLQIEPIQARTGLFCPDAKKEISSTRFGFQFIPLFLLRKDV
ncbi:hypothetical protein B0J14DRAFT_371550 [Halenospora varia]|nr:hypothetical protein B0J14DRAFT_371550 [Halenospora varia]